LLGNVQKTSLKQYGTNKDCVFRGVSPEATEWEDPREQLVVVENWVKF
jgi:hypothetical protein